ncbi:hypothetical protein BgiMline_002220 [Biomphalaria glabrata]
MFFTVQDRVITKTELKPYVIHRHEGTSADLLGFDSTSRQELLDHLEITSALYTKIKDRCNLQNGRLPLAEALSAPAPDY